MLEEEDIAFHSLKSDDPFLFVMGKHILCHGILQNKTIAEIKCLEVPPSF